VTQEVAVALSVWQWLVLLAYVLLGWLYIYHLIMRAGDWYLDRVRARLARRVLQERRDQR
jgi:hypothetical protein